MRLLLRIGGAFCRLNRRKSTIFTAAAVVIILAITFQLYSYRREGSFRTFQKFGNYEYRPGLFLKDVQPNENETYCRFNYGLPETLDWKLVTTYPSPEKGGPSAYKVIYNAIEGTAYANRTKYETVTYATQATPEFLYHVLEIARFWEGPISLAVFVPHSDLDLTMQIMAHLCKCYHGMSKVSMHLFYPQRLPPVLLKHEKITQEMNSDVNVTEQMRRKIDNYRNLGNKTRADYVNTVRKMKIKRLTEKHTSEPVEIKFSDCTGSDYTDLVTYRRDHHMVYPINVGRNVARNASKTNYFIVSDIEMVPSDRLASKFVDMLNKLMGVKKREDGCVFTRSVFVVPLFEVERGEEIPRDKNELVSLVNGNRASYFHQKTCPHCQRFPGLQSWLARPAPDELEPMLVGKREYPYHRWEPLFFGTRHEPWYSESLSWEGRQDKMTQMAELCLLEYRFLVLDGGFLCHAAPPRSPARRARPQRANARHYAAILKQLRRRHGDRAQCKLDK